MDLKPVPAAFQDNGRMCGPIRFTCGYGTEPGRNNLRRTQFVPGFRDFSPSLQGGCGGAS